MDANDPLIADDVLTDEERLVFEQKMREQGINPHELSPEEVKDLQDDMRSDRISNELQDDDDKLSDILTPEES